MIVVLLISCLYVFIIKWCVVIGLPILLSFGTVSDTSAVLLLRHLILTLGIPSIEVVGCFGQFRLHVASSPELQATHLTGSGELHVEVECCPRHLLHLIGVLQSSDRCSKELHFLPGAEIGGCCLLSTIILNT